MDRRLFTAALSAGIASPGILAAATGEGAAPSASRPFQIGMLVFDNMTYLDLAAPHDAWTKIRNGKVHLLARTDQPITTDARNRILPDTTLRDAPQLDLLFVGGGGGTTALMEDGEVLEFLRTQARGAQWITSVCTGALVLGAAGLLRGYRAATHWNAMNLLPLFGAEAVHERVVFDRNRITGGGVTAGLDFGLAVLARLFGEDLARLVMLGQEYDPAPPFDAGSPAKARPETVQRFRELTANLSKERDAAARRAASRLV